MSSVIGSALRELGDQNLSKGSGKADDVRVVLSVPEVSRSPLSQCSWGLTPLHLCSGRSLPEGLTTWQYRGNCCPSVLPTPGVGAIRNEPWLAVGPPLSTPPASGEHLLTVYCYIRCPPLHSEPSFLLRKVPNSQRGGAWVLSLSHRSSTKQPFGHDGGGRDAAALQTQVGHPAVSIQP